MRVPFFVPLFVRIRDFTFPVLYGVLRAGCGVYLFHWSREALLLFGSRMVDRDSQLGFSYIREGIEKCVKRKQKGLSFGTVGEQPT